MSKPFAVALSLLREVRTAVEQRMFEGFAQQALLNHQPATLLHVNGTQWRMARPAWSTKGALAATVRAACDFLGCTPTRSGVIARLLDVYPEFEPRLLPIAIARSRTDRVRAAQPLLAAMIVAHSASVAHLMKHG